MNIALSFRISRWDFVFQRPQHLLSRAAKNGPCRSTSKSRCRRRRPRAHARSSAIRPACWSPCRSCPHALTADAQLAVAAPICSRMRSRRIVGGEYVLWFYTPMALPFTHDLMPRLSCTTAWTSSRRSPALRPSCQRESATCSACADVVFTGGHSALRSEARTAMPTCTRFRAASTSRISPARAQIDVTTRRTRRRFRGRASAFSA